MASFERPCFGFDLCDTALARSLQIADLVLARFDFCSTGLERLGNGLEVAVDDLKGCLLVFELGASCVEVGVLRFENTEFFKAVLILRSEAVAIGFELGFERSDGLTVG